MDVFRFINSRDIREHLEKIGYQFSTREAACLVGHSKTAAMQERIDAWEEIIATMPDCAPQHPQKTTSENSFHALLREYIELQKKMLALFYDGEGAVYQYSLEKEPDEPSLHADWMDDYRIFPHAENCIRACAEEWKLAEKEGWGTARGGKIIKHWLHRPEDGDHEKKMEMSVNKNGEPLFCHYDCRATLDEHQTEINNLLEDMWFDIPTPFERGDILIDLCNPWNPFVLDSLATWGSRKMQENGFPPAIVEDGDAFRERMKNGGQWCDMNYYVWYYRIYSAGLFHETGFNYMDLERYRGPLKDGYRTLQAVSRFLKDWIHEGCMNIELLCNAFILIQQQEQCRDFEESLWGYTDEGLRDYGIPRRE